MVIAKLNGENARIDYNFKTISNNSAKIFSQKIISHNFSYIYKVF